MPLDRPSLVAMLNGKRPLELLIERYHGDAIANLAWHTAIAACMRGDPDLLENHCGAFAADCNVWAPMYAQAGMLQQVCKVNMDSSPKATPEYEDELIAPLLIAYADIKRAFAAFLASRPDASRPFIVAGHSQGSVLLSKIVRECIDGQPCSSCFVAGYLTGGYVPHDLFGAAGSGGVHNCAGPDDTGCVISYCTRIRGSFVVESLQALGGGYGIWPHMLYWLLHDRYGERPSGTDDVSKPRLEINPATWTEQGGGTYLGAKVAGRDAPLLPPEGGAAYGACVRVTDKAVWVVDPRPWCTNVPAGPAKHGNLHPIDLQFWHFNIKENVPTRIAAWRAKQGVLL